MSEYFVTADTHYSHDNIIKFCERPFASVEEHDEALIANHNAVVGRKDTVIHIGDFCFFNDAKKFMKIFSRLNGNFIVFRGNHDKHFGMRFNGRKICEYFGGYHSSGQGEMRVAGETVFFNHYPCLSWNASCHGRVHLFGHRHSSPKKIVAHMPNSYDCGVDNNGYAPVHIEEALRLARSNDPGTLDLLAQPGLLEIEERKDQ